ncbi:MAG: type VI secretion system lipoprotein TssJ [Desulfobacterales bacterium]
MTSNSCLAFLKRFFHSWSTAVTFMLLGISMFLLSCQSARTDPPPVQWRFEPNAIEISYVAAEDLNQYNNSDHTLLLNVYQLSDSSDFKNYIETADGVGRLLNLYDPDRRKTVDLKGLEDFQSFVVNPGTKKTLKIDRVKNAEWVGLVAGYFNIRPASCTALYRIPVKKTEEGLIRKKVSTNPADLHIDIRLGANAMHTNKDGS